MKRSKRTLYVDALDLLLKGKMIIPLMERDWELLEEIAKLAEEDAPNILAFTDPALYRGWRNAVTKYHLKGWTNITPERVRLIAERENKRENKNETLLIP